MTPTTINVLRPPTAPHANLYLRAHSKQAHALQTIHDQFWNPLVCWFINHTPLCARSLIPDWSDVTLYNRYEFFYETLVVGILTYLVQTVPGAILRDRTKLFELAKDNKGDDQPYQFPCNP